MRTARLFPTLTAAALALPLLTGCGGSSTTNSSSGGGPAGSSAESSGSSAGSASGGPGSASAGSGSSSGSGSSGSSTESAGGGKAVSCAAAPAAMVSTALGDTLGAAEETRNGDTIVVCDYKGTKAGLVKLRIQTDSSASAFAVDKKSFATQKMPTTDEKFADEAFSNVLGSGNYQVTTLVARRGSVEILIAAKATVAQEKGLLSQLFNKL
jgi:hypothetical protein